MIIGAGGHKKWYTDNNKCRWNIDNPTLPPRHRQLFDIDYENITHRVDNPMQVPKEDGDWIIFCIGNNSVFNDGKSRLIENITDKTRFFGLWADIDKGDIPLADEICRIISLFIFGANCEIYNTASATSELRKARVIIPLIEGITVFDWIICQKLLNNHLEKYGIKFDKANIKPVQLCFLPNKGEFYKSCSIRDSHFFNPLVSYSKEIKELKETQYRTQWDKTKFSDDTTSVFDMLTILCTGLEPYHDTQLKYSKWQILSGITPNVVKDTMLFYINLWEDGSIRWNDRKKDINKIVDGAIPKYDEVDWKDIEIEDIIEGRIHKKLTFPMPPGRLGDLITEIYDMHVYQYKELAFITGIAMLAGIVGRRFNVGIGRKTQGLNVYISLLMGTGMGKEQITETIYDTLMKANVLGKGKEFIGAVKFTAGRKLLNNLIEKRSHLCIFTEAGLLMQSKSGDQASLTKTLLEIYGKSGKNGWKGAEGYSKAEDSIPPIRSPALTLISESTPSTILNELHKGNNLENGLLPRQSLYRIECDKPTPNFKAKEQLSSIHMGKINQLIELCIGYQTDISDKDMFVNMFVPSECESDDFYKFAIQCVNMENEYRRTEQHVKLAMSTRAFVKVMKYAAIATLYNSDELPNNVNCDLLYGLDEWIWAKNVVMYELENTMNFFNGSNFVNPIEDLMISLVIPTMVRMRMNCYSTKIIRLTPEEIKKNHIPWKKLSQALKGNEKLNINGVDNPLEGLDRVLLQMEQMGYLEKIEVESSKYTNRTRQTGYYKHTDVFVIKQGCIELMKSREQKREQ